MTVTTVKIDTAQPFEELERYLPLLSPDRRQRIAALRRDEDRVTSFFTELLITCELAELLNIPRGEVRYGRNPSGKPVLPDGGLHFSVSHSAGLIAFAAGRAPLGLDVQRLGEPRSGAARFFTEGERRYIAASPSPDDAFFEVWTAKEAYVKYLGTGLSCPFRGFDVTEGSLGCRLVSRVADGCMLTVCCAEEIAELEIVRRSPEYLLDKLKTP